MSATHYGNLIDAIIKAQEGIIGPLAHDIADRVVELHNKPNKAVIEELVKRLNQFLDLRLLKRVKMQ